MSGCVASLLGQPDASGPSSPSPPPLLVLLHGDWGHSPGELLATWERHAASRGVALLALRCPRELGCDGSFLRRHHEGCGDDVVWDVTTSPRADHGVEWNLLAARGGVVLDGLLTKRRAPR